MSKPLEAGDLAVITKDIPASGGMRAFQAGYKFVVEEYVDAEEAEQSQGYYVGTTHNSDNFSDVEVDEEFVRLETPGSEVPVRRAPTVAELRSFLGGALLDDGENITVHQTMPDGEDSIEIFGRTAEGLPFGATLQITSIYKTDY